MTREDGSARDGYATSVAAYVLVALSPQEHTAFASHLESCPQCRRDVEHLADLPRALARVDADVVAAMGAADVPPVPDTLLAGLLREVERGQHRRRLVGAALVTVAAAALMLGVLRPATSTPDAPPSLTMRPLIVAPITASVDVVPHTWGTQVDLRCTYSAGDGVSRPYTLVVISADGRRERIGTWTAAPGKQVRLSGATSTTLAQIAAVEVQTTTGLALLRVDGPRLA